MDARRQQHHAMPAPLQSQQFPPVLHPQSGSGAGGQHHPRHPVPVPAGASVASAESQGHMAPGGPRPSSGAGPNPPLSGQKRPFHHRSSDGAGFAKLFVGSLPRNISEDEG